MRLPARLAFRYIVKRRSGTLVHVISGISVLVISSVAAAMICILSAFNGIEDLVKTLFGTLDADVAVVPASGATLPDGWGVHLEGLADVAAWAPVLEDECVVRANDHVRVASLLGVDKRYSKVSSIDGAIVEGVFASGSDTTEVPCACLGLGVRSELQLRSQSEDPPLFSMSAPIRGKRLSSFRERAFRTVPMHACGTFSINADLDTRYLMVPLSEAQTLLGRPTEVSRYEVQGRPGVAQETLAASVTAALQSALGEEWKEVHIRTRDEKHKFVTQTNQAEKWATFAILSFILVVAAFNIMASLTMLLLDKKRDLEVLRAMGMPTAMMQRTFGLQGMAINVLGGLSGALLGALLVMGQTEFGWLTLEGSVVPAYPVRLSAWDVMGTLAVVVLVGGIGSSAMVRHLIRRQEA